MLTAFWVGMELAITGVLIVRQRSSPLRSLSCPRHFAWARIMCRNRGPKFGIRRRGRSFAPMPTQNAVGMGPVAIVG
jgi:hypothetical protein